MLPTFENLQNVLLQEQKIGCQNTVVVGGLEQFMAQWPARALKEAVTPAHHQQIEAVTAALKRYPRLSPAQRNPLLAEVLTLLNGSPADTPSPARQRPAPPAEKTPAPRPQPAVIPRPAGEAYGLSAPVTRLPGVKEGMAAKLAHLGVATIGDLLTLYPRRYVDYRALKTISQLDHGEEVTIIARVWQTTSRKSKGNQSITTVILSDDTATMEAIWFNQPWIEKNLTAGKEITVSGKVSAFSGRLVFQSPEWEYLDKKLIHTGRLSPVYPLTNGLTARWMRTLQNQTVECWAPRLPEHLPAEITARLGLPALAEAIRQIHFPDSWEALEAARHRLAFDELLMIQLGVLKQRQTWKAHPSAPVIFDRARIDRFIQALPYTLTPAQHRALDEILADMARPAAMSRLLQGDVGSGKTVVALAAMLAACDQGGQAVILAPTEILAEQHYLSMGKLLKSTGQAEQITIELLTGSTKAAQRTPILAGLADGSIRILVGTHAVIQKDVAMRNLRLAVVDEQHRFGVEQRGVLRQKGANPHMLVMSATPIPRSLALTLYGDLDLSIIDQMPAGRQTIKTYCLLPKDRGRAYTFLRDQIQQGRQAFIICPLVQESDKIEAKSAIEEHGRLQKEVFPDLTLSLLHGRMSGKEKDAIMADFRDGRSHILVSTSVVEVGIDIPNASVILIEGANRFGLAQLHQFRGRVGRGSHPSCCLLLSDSDTPESRARLDVMEKTNNGFELAEADLKLRGPGEFFGTKQSGLPSLKLVKLSDTKLLELARTEAKTIFNLDPTLAQPQHHLLAKNVAEFWSNISDPS